MNRAATITLRVTLLGSLLVLWLSVWPGLLLEVAFVGFFLGIIPCLGLAIVLPVIGLVAFVRGWRPAPPSRAATWKLLSLPLIAAATLALLLGRVPCRAAFWISQSTFAAAARELDAPLDADDTHTRATLNRRLGVYLVDEYGIDGRGGIYFRVYEGRDGIGPDRTSYGFARKPNSDGSPFGAAHYRLVHLTGDWYLFAASNDWF